MPRFYFASLVALLPLLFSGCTTTPSAEQFDAFEVLDAKWGYRHGRDTCTENPYTISFSPERDEMYISFRKPTKRYDGKWVRKLTYEVVGQNPEGLLIVRLHGETRVIHGDPVVFRIRIFDGNRFYWEETDLETAYRREGGFYRTWKDSLIRCRF